MIYHSRNREAGGWRLENTTLEIVKLDGWKLEEAVQKLEKATFFKYDTHKPPVSRAFGGGVRRKYEYAVFLFYSSLPPVAQW